MKKTVLITGSTRGIGKSLAIHLAEAEYIVFVNGTNRLLIDEVVHEIQQAGGEAIGYRADIGNSSEVKEMIDRIKDRYSRIDVFIHNAGHVQDKKIRDMSEEAWTAVLRIHLNGAFYCIQHVLPHMEVHGGDIVMMTSLAGLQGSVGQVNYSAAKAGVLGMIWTLSAELQRYRIRVNGISPAALTDMTRPVIEHMREKYAQLNEPFPAFWNVGQPDDVARFVVALLAQPAQDLTGEIFGVNGTKITQWQKPAPALSEYNPEDFFKAWHSQKGRT
ncbi:3-oxoacyl-[acyl-carrier protein] reductase [Paenibacillus shirakamiensis]|uniref:3-oxoacyl-[acyl-carrier protein] reductase n=1 Tax=Paenibacillus shirakamiensis TaxID=1265935 RepID=A0ABS4JDV4_9BACL|nr:SDR family NAD(P)-dependent oxidoreductase [Paenibacillus shirakamiensis]MBP1999907.1 3-oxoacyl-[acyl-carrier protein] reductase [Paenibacillus shirakamiensis]